MSWRLSMWSTSLRLSDPTNVSLRHSHQLLDTLRVCMQSTPPRWAQALTFMASVEMQFHRTPSAEEVRVALVVRALSRDREDLTNYSSEVRAAVVLESRDWKAAAEAYLALENTVPDGAVEALYYRAVDNPSQWRAALARLECDPTRSLLASLLREHGLVGWEAHRMYEGRHEALPRSVFMANMPPWGQRWIAGFRVFGLLLEDARRDRLSAVCLSRVLSNRQSKWLWNAFNHPTGFRLYIQATDVLLSVNCTRLAPLLQTDGGIDKLLPIMASLNFRRKFCGVVTKNLSQLQDVVLRVIINRRLYDRVVTFQVTHSRTLEGIFPSHFPPAFVSDGTNIGYQMLKNKVVSLNGEVLTRADVMLFEGQDIVFDFKKMLSAGKIAERSVEDDDPSKMMEVVGSYYDNAAPHPTFLPGTFPHEQRKYFYLTFDGYHVPSLEAHCTVFESEEVTQTIRRERTIIRKAMALRGSPVLGDVEYGGGVAASPLVKYPALFLTERTFRHALTGEKVIVSFTSPNDTLESICEFMGFAERGVMAPGPPTYELGSTLAIS